MIRRLVGTALGGLVGAFFLDRWLGRLSVDEDGRPVRPPVRTEVEVDAPIGVVWQLLADIERQPEWMAEMKAVRLLTDGPIGVGTRGLARVRIFGIGVSDPVEVVAFSPPHRFAIRHEGRFSGEGLITLDTLDGGRRTRVVWAESLVAPVFPDLAALVGGPILERIFQADLRAFAALVEDGTAAGAAAVRMAAAGQANPPGPA